MRNTMKTYLLLCNAVVAILLIAHFEPLSEGLEVINEKAVPMLRHLHERIEKQIQTSERMHSDNQQALAYIERMLAEAQDEASRLRVEFRIIATWLLVNAILSWWCFR